jgi:hypothetical protein
MVATRPTIHRSRATRISKPFLESVTEVCPKAAQTGATKQIDDRSNPSLWRDTHFAPRDVVGIRKPPFGLAVPQWLSVQLHNCAACRS